MDDGTVVLRLVGAAALVGQRQQKGEARVTACTGGYGPVVQVDREAAELLLQNKPVRIPAGREGGIRHIMAEMALAGAGPDGRGVNWQGVTQ